MSLKIIHIACFRLRSFFFFLTLGVFKCPRARTNTHTHTHTNTHAYTHTRIHTHARTHTHAQTHTQGDTPKDVAFKFAILHDLPGDVVPSVEAFVGSTVHADPSAFAARVPRKDLNPHFKAAERRRRREAR